MKKGVLISCAIYMYDCVCVCVCVCVWEGGGRGGVGLFPGHFSYKSHSQATTKWVGYKVRK